MEGTCTQNHWTTKMFLEEKIEEQWNYIAHVWGIDADNSVEVNDFRNSDNNWMLEDFEENLKEYNELKAQRV